MLDERKIKIIRVEELKRLYDAIPDLCLIDVREQDEWQEQHIIGAIHIPKDELAEHIEGKVSDRTHPIYLHCRGGVRSLYAAECLLNMGYVEVYSVEGGIMEWMSAGYPVSSSRK